MRKIPENYKEAVGLAFAEACRVRGLTQDETADQLGLQQSMVSRMWSGRREISLSVLRKAFSPAEICEVLLVADRLLAEAKKIPGGPS